VTSYNTSPRRPINWRCGVWYDSTDGMRRASPMARWRVNEHGGPGRDGDGDPHVLRAQDGDADQASPAQTKQ